jgi:hypothetical protein
MASNERLDFRLSPEEKSTFEALAKASGLSNTDFLRWAIRNWEDQVNLNIVAGIEHGAIKADLPPSKQQKEAEASKKFRYVTELMESGGFTPPRYWPVNKLVPFEGWNDGRGYWRPDPHGVACEYVWSGRYDEDERENMIYKLLGPYSGLALGLGNTTWFPSEEAYQTQRDEMLPTVEAIVDAWLNALRRIEEADAKQEKITVEEDLTAAWLQYVRHNPGIAVDRCQEVLKAIGMSEDQHMAVRNALTFNYTQRRGVLTGEYPWYGM